MRSGNTPLDVAHLESLIERGFQGLAQRIDELEEQLALQVEKPSYTTKEVADRLAKKEYTVRELWCNRGRIRAEKIHGRGRQGEWRISHEELIRVQADGPSPVGTFDNRGRRLPPAVS